MINDKGFTLIELIVCILMLSLISGMIAMFVVTSSNSYNSIHNEVQMQTEADVALTFINELAVEAKGYGMQSFTVGDTDAVNCNAICILAPDSYAASISESEGVKNYYYIIWHQDNDNKLRFNKFEINDGALVKLEGHTELTSIADIDIAGTVAPLLNSNQCYLAQYVTGFSAELPDEEAAYPVLRLDIELEYAGSHFSAKKTIASRNLIAKKHTA